MVDATGSISDRSGGRDGREIVFRIEHVVKEVGQRVHGHERDDLYHVRIGVARVADGLDILVTDFTAGLDDLAREVDNLAICSAVKLCTVRQ